MTGWVNEKYNFARMIRDFRNKVGILKIFLALASIGSVHIVGILMIFPTDLRSLIDLSVISSIVLDASIVFSLSLVAARVISSLIVNGIPILIRLSAKRKPPKAKKFNKIRKFSSFIINIKTYESPIYYIILFTTFLILYIADRSVIILFFIFILFLFFVFIENIEKKNLPIIFGQKSMIKSAFLGDILDLKEFVNRRSGLVILSFITIVYLCGVFRGHYKMLNGNSHLCLDGEIKNISVIYKGNSGIFASPRIKNKPFLWIEGTVSIIYDSIEALFRDNKYSYPSNTIKKNKQDGLIVYVPIENITFLSSGDKNIIGIHCEKLPA